jgi:tetraacyldisaccharide 4'-kinase
VLVDGRRGPLLPAGPLRERMSALARAHAVLLVDDAERATPGALPVAVPVHTARVEATALVESVAGRWIARPLALLGGKRVVAVAGIARPERFYQVLRQWEAMIAEVFEFRDHHQYTAADWHAIARRGHEADLIVTTEKDLVKLEAFPFESGKLMALRIAPVVERGAQLIDAILKKVGSRQSAVGSEESGH